MPFHCSMRLYILWTPLQSLRYFPPTMSFIRSDRLSGNVEQRTTANCSPPAAAHASRSKPRTIWTAISRLQILMLFKNPYWYSGSVFFNLKMNKSRGTVSHVWNGTPASFCRCSIRSRQTLFLHIIQLSLRQACPHPEPWLHRLSAVEQTVQDYGRYEEWSG